MNPTVYMSNDQSPPTLDTQTKDKSPVAARTTPLDMNDKENRQPVNVPDAKPTVDDPAKEKLPESPAQAQNVGGETKASDKPTFHRARSLSQECTCNAIATGTPCVCQPSGVRLGRRGSRVEEVNLLQSLGQPEHCKDCTTTATGKKCMCNALTTGSPCVCNTTTTVRHGRRGSRVEETRPCGCNSKAAGMPCVCYPPPLLSPVFKMD